MSLLLLVLSDTKKNRSVFLSVVNSVQIDKLISSAYDSVRKDFFFLAMLGMMLVMPKSKCGSSRRTTITTILDVPFILGSFCFTIGTVFMPENDLHLGCCSGQNSKSKGH